MRHQQNGILIRGGNFLRDGNMGDKLMFHVVLSQARAAFPNARFAMAPCNGPYFDRSKHGLYQLLWPFSLRSVSGSMGHVVLSRYRESFGILLESELCAILDFTGYRYADIGMKQTRDMAQAIPRWRAFGAQSFFLPQAFGPFSDESLRQDMRTIAHNASLIFCRDSLSAEYVREVAEDESAIHIAPDITIPFIPDAISLDDRISGRLCIVPNLWMIERTSQDIANAYIDFLSFGVEIARDMHVNSCIVMHSRFQDHALAEQIQLRIGQQIPCIYEADPVRLKAILGQAKLILGSRYHALVGGMSQGVPTLGTSWAPKYKGLFSDFGCPELLLDPREGRQRLETLLPSLLSDRTERDMVINRLRTSAVALSRQVDCMWSTVLDRIRIHMPNV